MKTRLMKMTVSFVCALLLLETSGTMRIVAQVAAASRMSEGDALKATSSYSGQDGIVITDREVIRSVSGVSSIDRNLSSTSTILSPDARNTTLINRDGSSADTTKSTDVTNTNGDVVRKERVAVARMEEIIRKLSQDEQTKTLAGQIQDIMNSHMSRGSTTPVAPIAGVREVNLRLPVTPIRPTGVNTELPPYAPQIPKGDTVGQLAGSPSVGLDGAFTYSIPIPVPPGTRGFAPSIALTYNSNMPGGIAGRGWSVSGAGGSISRRSARLATDGIVEGVRFEMSDRLSLNGAALVLVSGIQGAANSEYRFEINNNTRVIARGNVGGNGAEWFEVLYPDGSRAEYRFKRMVSRINNLPGNVSVAAKTAVESWHMTMQQDNAGNTIHYVWESLERISLVQDEEVILKEILYGGTKGNPAQAVCKISFEYEPRSGKDYNHQWQTGGLHMKYHSGSLSVNTVRLKSIRNFVRMSKDDGWQPGVKYNLAYSTFFHTLSHGANLVGVWAEDATQKPLPPTLFEYDDQYDFEFKYQGMQHLLVENRPKSVKNSPKGAAYRSALMLVSPGQEHKFAGSNRSFIGDVNGDGKTDAVFMEYEIDDNGSPLNKTINAHLYISDGTKLVRQSTTPTVNYTGYEKFVMMDVDRDGKTDLVVLTTNGTGKTFAMIFRSNGQEFIPMTNQGQIAEILPFIYGADNNSEPFMVGDINGDGKPDMVFTYRSGTRRKARIVLAHPGAFISFLPASPEIDIGQYHASDRVNLVDMTQSGKTDLVVFNLQEIRVYRATTNSFDTTKPIVTLTQNYNIGTLANVTGGNMWKQLLMDLNQDGLKDLLIITKKIVGANEQIVARVLFNNGFGFGRKMVQMSSPNNPPAGEYWMDISATPPEFVLWQDAVTNAPFKNLELLPGDYNGDSKNELMVVVRSGGGGCKFKIFGWKQGDNLNGFENLETRGALVEQPYSVDQDMKTLQTYGFHITGDINADGKTDIIAINTDLVGETFFRYVVYDPLFTDEPSYIAQFDKVSQTSGVNVMIQRFFLMTSDVSVNVYLTDGEVYDRLRRIRDGLGAQTIIKYGFATQGDVYKGDQNFIGFEPQPVFPEYRSRMANVVVKTLKRDNGKHDVNETDYEYRNSRSHSQGRGWLGFGEVRSYNLKTKMRSISALYQSFPFTGMPYYKWTEHQKTPAQVQWLEWTGMTYAAVPNHGGKTHYLRALKTESKAWDWGTGQLSSDTVTTTENYSAYNTPRKITTTNLQSSKKSVVELTLNPAIVTPSASLLDLPSLIKTAVTEPGKAAFTKQNRVYYIPSTSLVHWTEEQQVFNSNFNQAARRWSRVEYDTFGNAIKQTIGGHDMNAPDMTAVERFATIQYDPTGRFPLKQINELGHTVTMVYEPVFGNVTFTMDANSQPAIIEYDGFGRPVKSTDAFGHQFIQRTFVDPTSPMMGFIIKTGGTGLPESHVWHDYLGRAYLSREQGINNEWLEAQVQYNHLGQVVRESLPYLTGTQVYWRQYVYDPVQRPQAVIHPDGRVDMNAYLFRETQAAVNVSLGSTGTDPQFNQVQINKFNNNGELIESIDNMGNTVSYKYDIRGNLLETRVNGVKKQWGMIYDYLGRQTQITDADMGTVKSKYNVFDELIEVQDAKGQIVKYEYDKLGRTAKQIAPGNHVTTMIYDTAPRGTTGQTVKGALAKVIGPDGYFEEYAYDQYTREVKSTMRPENNGPVFQNQIEYDAISRVKSRTYPSGFKVGYDYEGWGYLANVKNVQTGKSYWNSPWSDEQGRLMHFMLGNEDVVYNQFDPKNGNLVHEFAFNLNTGETIQSNAYSYDKLGLVRSKTDSQAAAPVTVNYTYDKLNRLIQDGTATFTYNPVGNITQRSNLGTYTYNGGGKHSVKQVTLGAGNIMGIAAGRKLNYTYDANGNQTKVDLAGSGVLSLAQKWREVGYNWQNLPTLIKHYGGSISTVLPAQEIYEYKYSPSGKRLKQVKTTGGIQTVTYYAGSYEHVVKSGKIERVHYVSVPGAQVVVTRKPHASDPENFIEETRYVHSDRLGSPDKVTSQTGQVVESRKYDSFGRKTSPDNPGALNIGYTGGSHEDLDKSGLTHMGGRVYDHMTGRFLSADPFVQSPLNPQSYNRYSYVWNNPINMTDPSGFIATGGPTGPPGAPENPCYGDTFDCNGNGCYVYGEEGWIWTFHDVKIETKRLSPDCERISSALARFDELQQNPIFQIGALLGTAACPVCGQAFQLFSFFADVAVVIANSYCNASEEDRNLMNIEGSGKVMVRFEFEVESTNPDGSKVSVKNMVGIIFDVENYNTTLFHAYETARKTGNTKVAKRRMSGISTKNGLVNNVSVYREKVTKKWGAEIKTSISLSGKSSLTQKEGFEVNGDSKSSAGIFLKYNADNAWKSNNPLILGLGAVSKGVSQFGFKGEATIQVGFYRSLTNMEGEDQPDMPF